MLSQIRRDQVTFIENVDDDVGGKVYIILIQTVIMKLILIMINNINYCTRCCIADLWVARLFF
jgi:hypothetical protein